MQSPESKVDMAAMNAAIDKVLGLPPPAKDRLSSSKPVGR